jgi:hypothetical protein
MIPGEDFKPFALGSRPRTMDAFDVGGSVGELEELSLIDFQIRAAST